MPKYLAELADTNVMTRIIDRTVITASSENVALNKAFDYFFKKYNLNEPRLGNPQFQRYVVLIGKDRR